MKSKTTKQITVSELSKKLGVSRQLIAFHRRKAGAPKLDDVEGWLEYLAANGREGSVPAGLRKKIAERKLSILESQDAQAKIDLAERRKELIPFATVDSFLANLVGNIFFGDLLRMAEQYPGVLKGCDEVTIHQRVTEDIERTKARLKDALSKLKVAGQ